MSDLGTKENPHTVAPPGWHMLGVPYGTFCKCGKCGCVGRSTILFDFYAKKPGDPFRCESCEVHNGLLTEEEKKALQQPGEMVIEKESQASASEIPPSPLPDVCPPLF